MRKSLERRNHKRFNGGMPVTIHVPKTKNRYNGMMFNFSRQGMCIETDVECRPGEDVHIVVEYPPYASGPVLHQAEIMWSKELFDAVVFYRFAVGARFDLTVDYSLDRSNLPVKKRSGDDRRSGNDRRNGQKSRRK